MLSEEKVAEFKNNGYVVIEDFLSLEDCTKLRKECDNIIESNNFDDYKELPTFSSQASDYYFLTSTDKIRAFLEEDKQGIITNSQDKDKHKLLFNKIGHALHSLNPVFKQITFNDNVKSVLKALKFEKPVVCQSMYIFKQPFIGGKVVPHQDATYLHTEPKPNKIVGIWIALEDCTLENGCLSFIPGSQKYDLATRFIRNPNKEEFDNGKYLIYTNPAPSYNENDFVPVPVKAGSAIVIDGLVVHKSEANKSSKSRHIYTFHIFESENTLFSKDNWMEYSEQSFLPLYETN